MAHIGKSKVLGRYYNLGRRAPDSDNRRPVDYRVFGNALQKLQRPRFIEAYADNQQVKRVASQDFQRLRCREYELKLYQAVRAEDAVRLPAPCRREPA